MVYSHSRYPNNVIITFPRPRYADNLCRSLREHEFVSPYVFTSVPTPSGAILHKGFPPSYTYYNWHFAQITAASAIVRPMMNDWLNCCPPARLPRRDINFAPRRRTLEISRSERYLSFLNARRRRAKVIPHAHSTRESESGQCHVL